MSPKRMQLPRLDLARFGVSEIQLWFSSPWNNEVQERFSPLLNGSEMKVISVTPYTMRGRKHLWMIAGGQFEFDDAEKTKFLGLHLFLDASPRAADLKVPKADRR